MSTRSPSPVPLPRAARSLGSAVVSCVRVTLELGGKSAAIVLDDADLDATLAGLSSVVAGGPHNSRKWTALSLERIAAQLSPF